MPELPTRRREVGTIRRGLLWLALLAPFFFASYGFANWYASQQSEVPSLVFYGSMPFRFGLDHSPLLVDRSSLRYWRFCSPSAARG